MKRISFADTRCSLAQSLDMIGEWWTLLIIREAYFGTRRFSDFQSHLGIARNVLSERLDRLVANDILQRVPVSPGSKRAHYRLSEKGRDLVTVVIALVQWGDRWVMGPENAPVRMVDRATGEDIDTVQVRAKNGRPLGLHDIGLEPGPGADDAIRERFSEAVTDTGAVRWRIRRHMAA
jgi:DNA-binding HxlR family transcriptional regulator